MKKLPPAIICPNCDLLLERSMVAKGSLGDCPRCACRIVTPQRNSVDRILAISFTGLLVFFPAIFFPLLTIEALGQIHSASVLDSFWNVYSNGYPLVALMIFLSSILIPFLRLFLLFIVSLYLKRRRYNHFLSYLFRIFRHLEEWGMTEVYLIGVLITVIKVHTLATIHYETGFFAFILLSISMVLSITLLDRQEFWRLIDKLQEFEQNHSRDDNQSLPLKATAMANNILLCHDCSLPVSLQNTAYPDTVSCPRCNNTLSYRSSKSLEKTWALLICSIIFLVPANILPMMRIDSFGVPQYSTIMDGIIYFFHSGEYGIGLIIFIASILVPLFKILGLLIILLSVHFRFQTSLRQKSIMFRFIEFIGRWSMLDIFVVALMASLVNFSNLSSTTLCRGATFFTLLVISTMLAAISFDSRLLWDHCKSPAAPHLRPNSSTNIDLTLVD